MAVTDKYDLEKYDSVVGYGIGQNYEQIRSRLEGRLRFDYLADKKWEHSDIQEYDGVAVIRLRELRKLKNVLVVLFPRLGTVRDVIKRELAETEADICYIYDLVPAEYSVSSDQLIERLPVKEYQDEFRNRIIFDETIPKNIRIYFLGQNNLLRIGSNLSVSRLDLYCGNNSLCEIGDGTSLIQASCWVSDSKFKIGKDCMFSSEIVIRTHDEHHIFDWETHERINRSKDVVIGDQVWVGYRTILLAGAHIGTGSIVGAGAVTSSEFGEHVLIVGCPAKVLRENVCWSRDNTGYFQREWLEECADQNALNYMRI